MIFSHFQLVVPDEGRGLNIVFLLGLWLVGGIIIGIPLLITGIESYRRSFHEKRKKIVSIIQIIFAFILLLPAIIFPFFL